MFNYNFNILNNLFYSLIQANVDAETLAWLHEKADLANEDGSFNKFKIGFSIISRKVPKIRIGLSETDRETISSLRPNLSIDRWSVKKLCRVWLIMQINAYDRGTYIRKIEELFRDADMNELATLYASLPVLAYPEHWKSQCAEGIRSNIGDVLDSVIMDNPFPAENLSDEAWNQLVLKAFFTERDVKRIIGWEERLNENLIHTLRDYAAERKAANRDVDPALWEMIDLFERKHA